MADPPKPPGPLRSPPATRSPAGSGSPPRAGEGSAGHGALLRVAPGDLAAASELLGRSPQGPSAASSASQALNLRRALALRQACAHNPADTTDGRALRLALAETLLRQADLMTDGASRRALLVETARALEEADRGEDAGMIYERLGLWRRAAAAYEDAGALTNLEYVLEVISRQEAAEAAIDAAASEIDTALRIGHRRLAEALLREHTSERFLPTQVLQRIPRLPLLRRLGALEEALLRRPHLELAWESGTIRGQTTLHAVDRLRIGRAPDLELSLGIPALSRDHLHLQLLRGPEPGDPATLVAIDQGSRAGSFWRGEPLIAGEAEPLDGPGELGLGFAETVEVHPLRRGDGEAFGALLRTPRPTRWHLFLPGPGALHLTPRIALPIDLRLALPFLELTAHEDTGLRLNTTPLAPGSRIEAIRGDRLEILPATGPGFTLELRG